MQEILDIIKIYSPEELGGKILDEADQDKRDEMKGRLLAYNDMHSVAKVYEDKGLGKMKEYLDRFDPYAENLNLFINVYEPRAEKVIGAKIKALILLRTNLLAYLNDYAGLGEDNQEQADGGVHSEQAKEEASVEGESAKSEVPAGKKKRK